MLTYKQSPWNFELNVIAPNEKYQLIFEGVGEVGMSAPLGGSCLLETGGQRHEISGWFGGPAIWNDRSDRIALPFWTKGRSQKLAVIDVLNRQLLLSETTFSVLDLSGFENEIVTGIDSPIYRPQELMFDLQQEKMEILPLFRREIDRS